MALPAGVKAVNLGCGTTVAPGWINIDNSPNALLAKYPPLRWLFWKIGVLSDSHYTIQWPSPLIIRDLRKRLPFPDGSVDQVYSSHALEHLPLEDARKLVREIFRVLKGGGIVRIVVPDLALGARQYLKALATDPTDATAAQNFLNWLRLHRTRAREAHFWMYDEPSLRAMLTETGFTNIVVCPYRQGRVPDCDILDNRPEESLHLEAEKP